MFSNLYVKLVMNYIGRFQVKQCLIRVKYLDLIYVFYKYRMMKEMVLKYVEEVYMICFDDKVVVLVGGL